MKRFLLAFVAIIALGTGLAYAAMNQVNPPSLGGNSAFRNAAPGAITNGNNYVVGRTKASVRITDISTPSTHAHPVPQGGWISAFYCSVGGVLTEGSWVTVNVPDAGRAAAAGAVYVTGRYQGQSFAAEGLSQAVTEGSFFEIGTDGNSTNTMETWCEVWIDPMPIP